MALPPLVRSQSRALTAAGVRISRDNTNGNRPVGTDFRTELWQRDVFDLYDAVGAVRFASGFYERLLTRLKIFPATLDDTGKPIPVTDENDPAVILLNRIQDPSGGRTALLSSYGKLMFLTGEGYLFGRNERGKELWSFVWKEELRFDSTGQVTHQVAPSAAEKTFDMLGDTDYDEIGDSDAVAYRFWTPHPRFSQWADSPMRAVIEDAKELRLLSEGVMATASSRLPKAPILLVPQEISPGSARPLGTEDPKNNPFMRDLGEHFTSMLRNPSAAASLAPYVIFGMSEFLKEIRTVWLHNPDSDYVERDLRKETIERLAVGLDFPKEELLGSGDANHWGAWQISEDKWGVHGAPVAERFCDDLGGSFLRPALEDEGVDNWADYVVAYDASAIVVKPDRFKDAVEARKLGAINLKAVREAGSFTDGDKITDEDDSYEDWLLWSTRGAVGGEAEAGEVDQGNGPPSDQGPPPGQPGPVSEKTNLPDESTMRIMAAAELAVLRCREQAGVRIRRRKASCADCLERVKDVAHHSVAAALGPGGLAELGILEPIELVTGGGDLIKHLLVNWGYPEAYASRLAGLVELHAARHLLDDRPPAIPFGLVNA